MQLNCRAFIINYYDLLANMHVCTEEGRDFRNNYYETLIQTDIYDTYVYTCCGLIRCKHCSRCYPVSPFPNLISFTFSFISYSSYQCPVSSARSAQIKSVEENRFKNMKK